MIKVLYCITWLYGPSPTNHHILGGRLSAVTRSGTTTCPIRASCGTLVLLQALGAGCRMGGFVDFWGPFCLTDYCVPSSAMSARGYHWSQSSHKLPTRKLEAQTQVWHLGRLSNHLPHHLAHNFGSPSWPVHDWRGHQESLPRSLVCTVGTICNAPCLFAKFPEAPLLIYYFIVGQ